MARKSTHQRDPWESVQVSIRHAGRYPCRPDWCIDPAKSGNHCLFYIQKGMGWVSRDGIRLEGKPGDLFIWRQGFNYCAGHDPGKPVTVLSLGFWLRGPGPRDALRAWVLPDRLRLPPKERRNIEAQYATLIEEFASSSPADQLAARASTLQLLAVVLRMVDRLPESRRTGETQPLTTDRRVEAALSFLDTHLTQQLTAADLARAAHLSTEHFSVLFRRATGLTPMAYVRSRRMQVARELLSSETSSIAEVAKEVGFADPFHFSRVFNRLVGTSPSAYRSAFRNPFSP